MKVIKVERTGKIFSVASSQYLVTFEDGSTTLIWSPPFHTFTDEEEDTEAWKYAESLGKPNKEKNIW